MSGYMYEEKGQIKRIEVRLSRGAVEMALHDLRDLVENEGG